MTISARSRILAVDFGDRRTGLAATDPTGTIITPLPALSGLDDRSCAAAIAATARLPVPGNRRDWALLVVAGITSFALWPMLLSLGLARTSASHAALIMAMVPVFTGLIAAAFERRRPRAAWWIGVAVAVAVFVEAVRPAHFSYRAVNFADISDNIHRDFQVIIGTGKCGQQRKTGHRHRCEH